MGSDKAPVKKDQTMFSNYNLGEQFEQSSYTSDHIEGEVDVPNANKQITLAWTPVIPSSLTVTVNGVDYTDDGDGHIAVTGNAAEINYNTGVITFTNAMNDEVTCSYDYDNMSAPVQSPDIKLRIVTAPIQAKSRKLKTLYSFDKLKTVA